MAKHIHIDANLALDGEQIFKADWFNIWNGKLPKCTYIFQSYDIAFDMQETKPVDGDEG